MKVWMGMGVFMLVVALIMSVAVLGLFAMNGLDGQVLGFGAVTALEFALAILFFVLAYRMKRKSDAAQRKALLMQFYNKCAAEGITDIEKPLYQEKAKLVLPVDGAAKPAQLKGMCLSGGKPGVACTVEFTGNDLWAMEA